MPTVDLSTARPSPASLLDGLPRRLALTLTELRRAAELAGNAPLPFEVSAPQPGSLDSRMGVSRAAAEDRAYLDAIDSLHEASDSLRRRGLLDADGQGLDAGLAGAIGLLATPEIALDADIRVGAVQARAWHRQGSGALATLATVDGIVFELGWSDASQWTEELARIPVLPEDFTPGASGVPATLDLPLETATAAADAHRGNRADLVPVLLAQDVGPVTDVRGRVVTTSEAERALAALHRETTGRLRVLVTNVSAAGDATVVGVVSWLLLADGWHALRPHQDEHHRVEVRRVEPKDLPTELAPVLAEVTA